MDRNGVPTYQSTTVTSYNTDSPPQRYAASGEFPASQVKSTRIVEVNPYFDRHYIKTPSAILKLVELLFTFIAFVISVSTWSSHMFAFGNGYTWYPYCYGSAVWTDIVTSIAFLLTLTLLLMYLFHIIEKLYEVPWLLLELLYCMTVAFCLLIAGAVMIPQYGDRARSACVAFCWAAMITYIADGIFKFRAYRNDEAAQGV